MFEPLQMMTSVVSNVEKQKTVRNLGRHGFNLLERLKKLVYRYGSRGYHLTILLSSTEENFFNPSRSKKCTLLQIGRAHV